MAYLAGVFDGEGCVGFYVRPGGHKFVARVTMGHRETVERFKRAFGGHSYAFRHVVVPLKRRRQMFSWQVVSHSEVQSTLRALLPYLSIKKQEAELLLTIDINRRGQKLTPEQRETRLHAVTRMKAMKREVA